MFFQNATILLLAHLYVFCFFSTHRAIMKRSEREDDTVIDDRPIKHAKDNTNDDIGHSSDGLLSQNELASTSQDEMKGSDILSAYRNLEKSYIQKRAQIMRTGDISIALQSLNSVNDLFSRFNPTKTKKNGDDDDEIGKEKSNNNNTDNNNIDNSVSVQDSRAILNVSKLTKLSIQNLKLGEIKSVINLVNFILFTKRFMLKNYFNQNNLKEERFLLEDNNNENNNENNSSDNSPARETENILKENVRKEKYLQQFDRYSQFNQFNWYKLGSLYDNLSQIPLATDHLMGPFSIENKKIIRTGHVRIDENETNSTNKLTKADNITQLELNDKSQDMTTPEQVKRCFKILIKKVGKNEKISLFKFIINPFSFSKTIENLFYTSFLIKEGKIMLLEGNNDDNDNNKKVPMIMVKSNSKSSDNMQREIDKRKNQIQHQNHIIFQLNMETWKKLIEKFNITESFLP